MKSQTNPSPSDPKKKGENAPGKSNNGNTSQPGTPGNDPDQTPEREIKNPPQAEPGKQGGPNQNQDSPAYK